MIPLKLLLIANDDQDARLVIDVLRRGGYDVATAFIDNGAALDRALGREHWDIAIVLDTMAAFTGAVALAISHEHGVDLPFIVVVVSSATDEDAAMAAMQLGAHDYVMKGQLERLVPTVTRELQRAAAQRKRRRMSERLAYLAYHDPLTDLPNRNLFNDRLEQALRSATRQNGQAVVLVLDLDGFKEVNDTHGHHAGDRVLQQMAARLRRLLRGSDTVARVGGDEFAVLLPMTDPAGAEQTSRKILQDFDQPFPIDDHALIVRASIGGAVFPAHASTADELLQKADAAMYAAKTTRSGFAWAMVQGEVNEQQVSLVGEMRRAVVERQIAYDYQPILDLRSGAIVGVEALLRWDHPEGRLMSDDFIRRIADSAGLMGALAEFSIERALMEWSAIVRQQPAFAIVSSLSRESLHSPSLLGHLRDLLAASQVAPGVLILKIAEHLTVSEPERSIRCLTELRDLGVRIAIDGFGIGYSSLHYLSRLPAHELRIDPSFVAGLAVGEDDALVRAIIDVGHDMHLRVVADGVETEDIRDRLAALGCDAVQGHVVHAPAAATVIAAWMQSRGRMPPRRGA